MWGGNDWTKKPVWLLYKPIIINVIQIIIQHALSIIIKIWAKALCICGLRSLKWNGWNECLFLHFWREKKYKMLYWRVSSISFVLGLHFQVWNIYTNNLHSFVREVEWGWVGRDLKQIFASDVCVCAHARMCVCLLIKRTYMI